MNVFYTIVSVVGVLVLALLLCSVPEDKYKKAMAFLIYAFMLIGGSWSVVFAIQLLISEIS